VVKESFESDDRIETIQHLEEIEQNEVIEEDSIPLLAETETRPAHQV
jgi:hypothetical protein